MKTQYRLSDFTRLGIVCLVLLTTPIAWAKNEAKYEDKQNILAKAIAQNEVKITALNKQYRKQSEQYQLNQKALSQLIKAILKRSNPQNLKLLLTPNETTPLSTPCGNIIIISIKPKQHR